MILQAKLFHAARIAEIYNFYINHSTHTFELEPVDASNIYDRISSPSSIQWFVSVDSEKVRGYAYAAKWKDRAAYVHTAEVSIYLDPEFVGRKIGQELYNTMFEHLKKKEIKAVIAGIALPNPLSIAFHERFGFKKVAHFEKVGYKFGTWIDVAYWQLML